MKTASASRFRFPLVVVATGIALVACIDTNPTEPSAFRVTRKPLLTSMNCVASLSTKSVACSPHVPGLSANVIGGQNLNLKVTTSNVTYDPGTTIFGFDLTLQNLLNEQMGTPGEGLLDPRGIRIFFHGGPTVTGGTGIISVLNADGTEAITAPEQPYFVYNEILDKDEVSSTKRWELSIPSTVTSFSFLLLVHTEIAPKLIINEVMVNPEGTSTFDTDLEWLEIYNAGSLPVELQNLVIADSAASGRRPYHVISSSVTIQPGAYAVLGSSTNTTLNGGAPVDYSYGGTLVLANSLDAVKIARVFGTDTITIDRTQYANAAVSAQSGISRELKNPALDNSNMDGSNWANSSVTAVYGSGGRGTPKAQNSMYTP